jgi:polyisoprenyl-phosphate glycosyltransferase
MHKRLTTVFQKIGCEYEIIYVNDNSPDDAREVLTALAARDPHLVVINHSRNFGAQSAFTSGMRISTGDAVVLLDGDLQDPPELIEQLAEKWREGYDVVYGVRVKRVATRFLQIAYKAFYRVFRAASYVPMPLDAGDFSLLDRRVVNAINDLPENNRLIRGLRSWVGFTQTGVPYVRPERMFGRTTFSYAPLDIIIWVGLATVGLSFVAIVVQLVLRLFFPDIAPRGFTLLFCFISFLGGIQLLSLSIIGSYMAHIYDEVKRRPAYIVESILNDPRQKVGDKTEKRDPPA